MKKKSMVFGSIFIFCLLLTVLLYPKYGKFLPTFGQDSLFPPPLNIEQVQKIKNSTPIDSIHVYKNKRYMTLEHQGKIIRRYPIRLGFSPTGHKVQEGDGKTPEGQYFIDWRNSQSAFYKSLHISYPNISDQQNANKLGVSAGGNIMIHGSATIQQTKVLPNLMTYFPQKDWTWGCIAVRNVDIDEIWQLVDNQTVIEIHP